MNKIMNFINSWKFSAFWLVWTIGCLIWNISTGQQFGIGLSIGCILFWFHFAISNFHFNILKELIKELKEANKDLKAEAKHWYSAYTNKKDK